MYFYFVFVKYVVCFLGCIGCVDWNKCCIWDVFGSCVECLFWNKCCYKMGDFVCVVWNYGCDYIRKVVSGNFEDVRVSINFIIYYYMKLF